MEINKLAGEIAELIQGILDYTTATSIVLTKKQAIISKHQVWNNWGSGSKFNPNT